eukprot:6202474-Pyramimonas_sp.AAC.1
MYWKPVLRPAGRARDAHGKPIYWLHAQLHALVCYSQDWTVNACNASDILKSLADPDAAVQPPADSEFAVVFRAAASLGKRGLS